MVANNLSETRNFSNAPFAGEARMVTTEPDAISGVQQKKPFELKGKPCLN